MAVLSKDEVRELMASVERPSISLLMPTHLEGQEVRQDPIRLKNLTHEAVNQLVAGGMRRPDAEELLRPLQGLLTAYEFWQRQEHGLAVFVSPRLFRFYRVPTRLDEQVIINNRFYFKPLLPLLTDNGRFYVLALSQDSVRLFEGSHYEIGEIELEGVPKSVGEALPYDIGEKEPQMHSAERLPGEKRKIQAVFTGQGDTRDVYKNNILRFFRKVDAGVRKKLANAKAPLVLAGVEYLHPIYREANSYPNVLDEGIIGNTDDWSEIEFHQRAWPLVEPIFQQGRRAAADHYHQYMGEQNGLASANLQEIVPASYNGRVDTLFVALQTEKWGKFDRGKFAVELHKVREKGDEDLLDLAAMQTFLHDGTVYALPANQVPSGKSAAAVFRYKLV